MANGGGAALTAARRTRLVDCNPRWARSDSCAEGEDSNWLQFDCPEGHQNCQVSVPFSPSLKGAPQSSVVGSRTIWTRTGDTFETLTLSPSILMTPTVTTDGRVIDPCALHIFIRDGAIEFCGDSR